jgi:P-type E1-E2 ATPase
LSNNNLNELEDQFGVNLLQTTHKINDHEVEIQSQIIDLVNVDKSLSDADTFNVIVGSERWLAENEVEVNDSVNTILAHERAIGNISVLVAVNGRIVAIFSIADQVKPDAAITIYALRKMGIHVVLLTGDNAKTAEATAKKVGIREGSKFYLFYGVVRKNPPSESFFGFSLFYFKIITLYI